MSEFHTITLNERVCAGCIADAKLGRMVRRYLTVGGHCGIGRDGDGFWASRMEEVEPDRGDTIDEALERAMGEGK